MEEVNCKICGTRIPKNRINTRVAFIDEEIHYYRYYKCKFCGLDGTSRHIKSKHDKPKSQKRKIEKYLWDIPF